MKRFFIICSIYTLFLCIPIEAQSTQLKYKIYTSSQNESLLEMKMQVMTTLDHLLKGVDVDSYDTIVKENLDLFMYEKDIRVSFKRNTLYVVLKDGKGKNLNGTYTKSNVCYEEVKPKSLLKEWWKNATDKE